VLDRKGLEAAACQCYEVIKDMHDGAQAVPNVPAVCKTPISPAEIRAG
jgi:hypothetical protein